MEDREFHFACAALDDHQSLIAAGKTQRWEVVKWAFILNVALAAATVALNDADAGLLLFELAVAVALGAALLVIYYNKRLTNMRNDALITQEFIASKKIDIEKITGKAPKRVTWHNDWGELVAFAIMLFFSIIPAWVVASAILLKNSEQGG
jgi:hypothetical protein